MISRFDTGKWYKISQDKIDRVRTGRENLNPDLLFLCDGKPHQVNVGDGMHASFYDCPDSNWKWVFSDWIRDFEEVDMKGKKTKVPDRSYMVIQRSCNNLISKKISYAEACQLKPPVGDKYEIYKMVLVAEMESNLQTKITKAKKVR